MRLVVHLGLRRAASTALQPFANFSTLASALERLARRVDLVPMVILREHEPWLRAMFHTRQIGGEYPNFAVWAGHLGPQALRFTPLLGRHHAILGIGSEALDPSLCRAAVAAASDQAAASEEADLPL